MKKKIHFQLPEMGIELLTLENSNKAWFLDINAVPTWLSSHLFISAQNLKVVQYSTKFH